MRSYCVEFPCAHIASERFAPPYLMRRWIAKRKIGDVHFCKIFSTAISSISATHLVEYRHFIFAPCPVSCGSDWQMRRPTLSFFVKYFYRWVVDSRDSFSSSLRACVTRAFYFRVCGDIVEARRCAFCKIFATVGSSISVIHLYQRCRSFLEHWRSPFRFRAL